ncbi:peptidase M41 family protein [Mycobacterium xenopi 3993]|nr:peptidase M41 family protein [Mycobacterium xenopi 3993]
MISQLVFAMGGRAAEELVFREPTTGAVSDIEQATKIARAMVTEFGMSSKLGAVKYGTEHGDPFLGRTIGTQPDYSHEVARDIDEEIRKLIEAAHTEAWEILTEYRDVLDTLAGELLEKETLHRPELEAIFADVEKRPGSPCSTTSGPHPLGQAADQDSGELAKSAVSRGAAGARTRVQSGDRTSQRRGGGAERERNTNGANGAPAAQGGRRPGCSTAAPTPDYGARRAGAPRVAPQQPNYWYPPPSSPPSRRTGTTTAELSASALPAGSGAGDPPHRPTSPRRAGAARGRPIRRPRLTHGGFDGAAKSPYSHATHAGVRPGPS